MKTGKQKKDLAYVFVLSLFVCCVLVFAFRLLCLHCQMIAFPYQLEYREGAMVLTTNTLLRGLNPFSVLNQPQYTNVYGIVYPLLMVPISKFLGVSIIVHRAVSAFFLWASCALLFYIMVRNQAPKCFALAGTLVFYASELCLGTTTADAGPHTLGLFLFLCSLALPFLCNYSSKSLMLSIVLGVLGLYTKAYFSFGILYMTIYLTFFVSKKKALIYALGSIDLILLSSFLIKSIFDTYFNNCFLAQLNCNVLSMHYALSQIKEYSRLNCALLVLLFVEGAMTLRINRKSPYGWLELNFWTFCLILSVFLVVFWIGETTGNYLGLYFQLITPFFVVVSLIKKYKNVIWNYLIMACFIFTLFQFSPAFKVDLNKDKKSWETLEALIAGHKNIYNAPPMVSMLIEQGKEVYASGQSGYFKDGGFVRIPWDPKTIIRNRLIQGRISRYHRFLEQAVKDRKFDLIVLPPKGRYSLVHPDDLKENYTAAGTITINMPYTWQKWILKVFQLKTPDPGKCEPIIAEK